MHTSSHTILQYNIYLTYMYISNHTSCTNIWPHRYTKMQQQHYTCHALLFFKPFDLNGEGLSLSVKGPSPRDLQSIFFPILDLHPPPLAVRAPSPIMSKSSSSINKSMSYIQKICMAFPNGFTTAFAILHLVTLRIKDSSLHGSDRLVQSRGD